MQRMLTLTRPRLEKSVAFWWNILIVASTPYGLFLDFLKYNPKTSFIVLGK